jgi:hypothetical protein
MDRSALTGQRRRVSQGRSPRLVSKDRIAWIVRPRQVSLAGQPGHSLTGLIYQPGRDKWDKSAGTGSLERSAGTVQPEPVSLEGSAWAGQPGRVNRDRASGTDQPS